VGPEALFLIDRQCLLEFGIMRLVGYILLEVVPCTTAPSQLALGGAFLHEFELAVLLPRANRSI
jgi:hypothetical protein